MNFDNPQENELEDLSKEEDSHSIASEKSNQNLQQLQNENKKEEDKLPDCCGVLGIEFIKATNLPIADIKTSDPYVKLYGKTNRSIYYFGKTKIIKKNLNPQWNEKLYFPAACSSSILIEIYDYDFARSDDFLAKIEIPINELYQKLVPISDEKISYTTQELQYDLISFETVYNRKIYFKAFIPRTTDFDLQTDSRKCDLCIAYLLAPFTHPLLKLIEINDNNEYCQTSKFTYENGIVKTPFKESFSKSYCISLSRSHTEDSELSRRFQFYLESYQRTTFKALPNCYITFIGIPTIKKSELTFDSGPAIDMSNKKNWPYYIEKHHSMFGNGDLSFNAIFTFTGNSINSETYSGFYSIYTQIEKDIENATSDQIPRLYKQINQLVGYIYSNPTREDVIFHREDTANLCQKLVDTIENFQTLSYNHEKMCLKRTQYILRTEFTGAITSKKTIL